MKIFRHNNGVKLITVICLISILFTSCYSDFSIRENIEYIKPVYSGNGFYKTDASTYETISESGLVELLFDENTATIGVRDTNSGDIWSTLPDSNIPKEIQSSSLEINLSDGGNRIYTLNTQDNSVAHGNFSYKTSSQGVSVTYSMALDKETGAKSTDNVKSGEIRADLTISYTLQDGSLYVNVDMNNVFLPKGIILEDITMLNNFGAFEVGSLDDYLFIPDGCGAILKTAVDDSEFKPVSLPVYGEDAATSDTRKSSECFIGAFGIKHFESAFVCIIEKGDSIAQINAYRNNENFLNSVNSSFKITDVCNKEKIGIPYKGEIQLCYRFLSGKSATYSGMATACRETLIRNSVLPTKSVIPDSDYMPMTVSLQGGYINENNEYSALTNYNQALSLMTLLRAKGVENVYLRYNGLYNKANNGNTDGFDDFSKSLGKKKDFQELYKYLNSQKYSLFIDTNILTYDSGFSGATAINGNRITNNTMHPFPANTSPQEYLQLGNLESNVNDIILASEKLEFDGYCLNDAGKHLYSDYSETSYSRQKAKEELSLQISALSNSKALMMDAGNFYALRNSDIISNIPVSPLAYPENDSYVGIPFVQMLLHGILEYSTTGFNTTENIDVSFLNAVEYGCIPSAYWYCTPFNENLDSKYYYDNNINEMVNYYIKANTLFSDFRDARMTSHYCVEENVYCTEYDNSIKVYVNYNDTDVMVNGVIVGAMDCITIS